MTRRLFLETALAQQPAREPAPPAVTFVCPMDRDVRQSSPGKCPRCGMKLLANLPEPEEYRLRISTKPRLLRAGERARLQFEIRHPKTDRLVRDFEVIHERVFHLFLISHDLTFFAHEHPVAARPGVFLFETTLPKASEYRLVADCYPKGATPQFLVKSLFTAGATLEAAPALTPDREPQRGENLQVELVTEPAEPIAGKETLLFFRLSPGDGVEQYLGAWGHMLAASQDLVDLVHDHPLYVTEGPRIQFNLIFPRATNYRVWVQFQRRGVVNTVAFTVPVKALGL